MIAFGTSTGRRISWGSVAVFIGAFSAYVLLVAALDRVPRNSPLVEMQTALPRFVQVAMTGGDRYLAANIAMFRALVASTERMEKENFRIQGIVQRDAAWLNPAHEDNYYIAAAILPWVGEYDAAQDILAWASAARPFDYQPAFYYAFDLLQFKHDSLQGARWLQVAARQTRDENERLMLEQMAAQWVERGNQPRLAARVVEAMAEHARPKAFKDFLLKRVQRLNSLADLGDAVANYRKRYGQSPRALSDLVSSGLIPRLPVDPLGVGFTLNAAGDPVFVGVRSVEPSAPQSMR